MTKPKVKPKAKAKADFCQATSGKEKYANVVTGCKFTAVQWDAQAVEAVTVVARALENLTKLFALQSIKIDTLAHIGDGSLVVGCVADGRGSSDPCCGFKGGKP